MAAANTNHPMTRHLLLAGFSLAAYGLKTTRDVQWYVSRRLSRPEAHRYNALPLGPLAQLVEQGTLNPKVAGSIPARPIARFACK